LRIEYYEWWLKLDFCVMFVKKTQILTKLN
jgi:hypothetical protein